MKQVIVIRTDLGLSTGKLIAQSVHAAQRAGIHVDYDENPVCVVCYVKSEDKLLGLAQKCDEFGVNYGLQRDLGLNEVEKDTPTVLCVADDEHLVNRVCKRLQTFKG